MKRDPLAQLRALKEKHALTNADIASLAQVSEKSVQSWLADPSAAMHRRMPPRHLALIQAALPAFLAARRDLKKKAAAKSRREK